MEKEPSEDQLKILNQAMSNLLGNVASAFLPKVKDATETVSTFLDSVKDEIKEEIREDTVYVVRENGESLGFFSEISDAATFLARRFDRFMLSNSLHYLRTERNQGRIRVFRRTPYLWFLFAEQCVLDMEVETVHRLDDYESESDEESEISASESSDVDETEDDETEDAETEEEQEAGAASAEVQKVD